jgi:hypothetical protein
MVRVKPSASRSRSSELYYLGTGFRLSPFAETYRRIVVNGESLTIDDLKQFPEMSPKALLNLKSDLHDLLDSYPFLSDKEQHQQARERLAAFLKKDKASLKEEPEIKDEDFLTRNPKNTEELDDWITRNKMKYSFTRNSVSSVKELGQLGDKLEEKIRKKNEAASDTNSSLFEEQGGIDILDDIDQEEGGDNLEDIDQINDDDFAREQAEIKQVLARLKGDDMATMDQVAQSGWESLADRMEEEAQDEAEDVQRLAEEAFGDGEDFEKMNEQYEEFLKDTRSSEMKQEREQQNRMKAKADRIQKRMKKGESLYDIWKNTKEDRI